MVGIKRARRGLAEQLEQLGAVRGGRVLTLPDGLEFTEIKQDEHMPGKPPPASKGRRGPLKSGTFRQVADAYREQRRHTPNPVKRKCGRCERLRAYARRMLAKVSGEAQ